MLILIRKKSKHELGELGGGSTLSKITGINIDTGIDFSFIDNITKEIGKGLNNINSTIAKGLNDTIREAGRGATNVIKTAKKASKDFGAEAQRTREWYARSDIGRSDIGKAAGDISMMAVGVGTETVNIGSGIAQTYVDVGVGVGTSVVGGTSQLLRGESRGAETIYKGGIEGLEKLYKGVLVEPMEKYVVNFYLALPDPTYLGPLGEVDRDTMFGIAITVISVAVTIFTAGTGTAPTAAAAAAAQTVAKEAVKQTLMQTMKTWVAKHFTAEALKALGKKALLELVKQKGIELMTVAVTQPVVKYNLDKAKAEQEAQNIATEAAFELFCDNYDCNKPLKTTDPEQLYFEKTCRGFKCAATPQPQPIVAAIEVNKKRIVTKYTDSKLPYILGGIGLVAAMTIFGGE